MGALMFTDACMVTSPMFRFEEGVGMCTKYTLLGLLVTF